MFDPVTKPFLCDGEPALARSAERFVEALGGGQAALLLQGGDNLQRYLPRYLDPWMACGLSGCDLIAPDDTGILNIDRALAVLDQVSGIFVGGGKTALYHWLYATGRVGERIRERCWQGTVYGGLSAGLLIAGPLCPLDREETGADFKLVEGLGLFKNVLFEPHFVEERRLSRFRAFLNMARVSTGYGVDEDACIILQPGQPLEVLGADLTPVRVFND